MGIDRIVESPAWPAAYWGVEQNARAFAQLDQVDREIRVYVKQLLDEYHGEERPQRYYDILVGYWLQWVTHAAVIALELPHSRAESSQDYAALAVVHTDTDLIDRVTADDGFHRWLRPLLEPRQSMPVGFKDRVTVFRSSSAAPGGFIRKSVKRCLSMIGNGESILLCIPYARCSRLQWLRFIWRARKLMRWDDLEASISFEVRIDADWRLTKFNAVVADGPSLLDAVKRLVPLLMPIAYLEGLQELRWHALRVPIGRPKAFYSAGAVYSHLLFKLLAAEYQHSTLLLGHQHGGSYGMELRHAPEEYERAVCDFFYTWGWDGGSGDTRPLSPPAFKTSAPRERWSLMLCLGDFPKSSYRIQFFPAGDASERTIRETLSFARNSSVAPGDGMLIRPFPHDYGRGWIGELREALPAAQVDDFSRSAIERFSESRIVFHNYLSTGLLESICLDIPAFALYDPNVYAFRAPAAAYVEAFERLGLLHSSGSSAAAFYTGVRTEIRAWWNQPELRSLRADFSNHYVRIRSDWQREWLDEFKWLLRSKQTILTHRPHR